MHKRSLAHRLDNKRCRILWWCYKHALLISIVCGGIAVAMLMAAVLDVATGPRRADFGASFLIYLAVMITTAIISAATAPKAKDPTVVESKAPTVKDGKGIVRAYGTVWFDDANVIGWKQLGTTPIKSEGGKKG